MDSLNAFTGVVRRCVDDYGMIAPGDRIAVGISGGKDSLVLLASLAYLRRYYPAPFALEGITIDTGFPGMDFSGVEKMCEELGVPYTRVPTDIREIVFDARQEENPCSLCSKMRRGALNTTMKEHGCNKLALGHHFDDAVETFMMSLLFEGRLSCFKPVTYVPRGRDADPPAFVHRRAAQHESRPPARPAGREEHLPDGSHVQAAGDQGSAHGAFGAVPGSAEQGVRRDAAPAARRLGPHAARARKSPRAEKRGITLRAL